MKVIVCELCDSKSFAKQNGMFVCQGCGTQYSPEEAKAMMKEVESEAPTAMVSDLDKYLLLARRAKDSSNNADAAKYYGMVEAEDPDSWEAMFYKVYFTAMQTNIAGISAAADLVVKCLPAVIGLIKNHTPEDQQMAAVEEVFARCNTIALMLANAAVSHYYGISSNIRVNYFSECASRVRSAAALPNVLGDELDKAFGADLAYHKLIGFAWEQSYSIYTEKGSAFINAPDDLLTKIGKYNKEFIRPHIEKQIAGKNAQIAKLEETTVPGARGSVFLIVFGAILTSLGLMTLSLLAIYIAPGGLAMLIIGIVKKRPRQKSFERLAQDKVEIDKLKKQIAELEATIK